jgi:hypothetical protein
MHVKSIMKAQGRSKAFLPKSPAKTVRFNSIQILSSGLEFYTPTQSSTSFVLPYTHTCILPLRLYVPAMLASPKKTQWFSALLLRSLLHSLVAFGRILITLGGGVFFVGHYRGIWVLGFIFIVGLGCWAGNQIKTGTTLWFHLLFFPPWDKLAPKSCFETLKFKP